MKKRLINPSNIVLIFLLLLFNNSLTLKSSSNSNIIPENINKKLNNITQKNESSIKNLIQKETPEISKKMDDLLLNNIDRKIDLDNDFAKVYNYWTSKIGNENNKCIKDYESIADKYVYNNVSSELYSKTENILTNYITELNNLEPVINQENKIFNIIDDHNSIDDLYYSSSKIYSSYQNIEDKYHITGDNIQLDLTDSNLINITFKKDEEYKQLINNLEQNNEYNLDREAYGQMLFDKFSWYMNYNTKREYEIMKEMEILKLKLENQKLKIKKLNMNINKSIDKKNNLSNKRKTEVEKIKDNLVSCSELVKIDKRCKSKEKIYNKMISTLELEDKYYNKIKEIINS